MNFLPLKQTVLKCGCIIVSEIFHLFILHLQRIYGAEAERNFYESQLIILDTLEKVLNSVSTEMKIILIIILLVAVRIVSNA